MVNLASYFPDGRSSENIAKVFRDTADK